MHKPATTTAPCRVGGSPLPTQRCHRPPRVPPSTTRLRARPSAGPLPANPQAPAMRKPAAPPASLTLRSAPSPPGIACCVQGAPGGPTAIQGQTWTPRTEALQTRMSAGECARNVTSSKGIP
eukprot:365636-Chlamydomonas_euryale.AAC.6